MSTWEYVNPVRNAIKIFSKERTPRQLALAVSLGMMVGLLPKGNLLAASFGIALLALRVNLGVGLTTAFVLTLCSPQLDVLTHGIGMRLFKQPTVYSWLTQLHQLPVVAWMSLNNTVVMGSFLLGSALFYPTYHGSERVFERLLPILARLRPKKKSLANGDSANSQAMTGRRDGTQTDLRAEPTVGAMAPSPEINGQTENQFSSNVTPLPSANHFRDSTSLGARTGVPGSDAEVADYRVSTFGPPISAGSPAARNRDSTFDERRVVETGGRESPRRAGGLADKEGMVSDSLGADSATSHSSRGRFASELPHSQSQSSANTSSENRGTLPNKILADGELRSAAIRSLSAAPNSSPTDVGVTASSPAELFAKNVFAPHVSTTPENVGRDLNPSSGQTAVDPGHLTMRPPLMTRAMLPSRKVLDHTVSPLGRPSMESMNGGSSGSDVIPFSHPTSDSPSDSAGLPDGKNASANRTLNLSAGE